jgi:hypothetical protein
MDGRRPGREAQAVAAQACRQGGAARGGCRGGRRRGRGRAPGRHSDRGLEDGPRDHPARDRQPARREPQGAEEARPGREDDPRQARPPDRRRADRGRRHQACFTVACGIGYDAEVMDATPPRSCAGEARLSRQRGRRADELLSSSVLTIDGAHGDRGIPGVRGQPGRMLPIVAPRRRIRPDDGSSTSSSCGPRAHPGPHRGLGRVVRRPGRDRWRTRVPDAGPKVEIETEPNRLVEVDGSVIGETPVSSRSTRGADGAGPR